MAFDGVQIVPVNLPSKTWSENGNDTINLRDLPATLFGRITHLVGISYSVTMTPTFGGGAEPTSVAGVNQLVTRCDLWDGSMFRFQGGFNHLRAKERLENGGIINPDADLDTASATARYFRRLWTAAPMNYEGSSDFAIPVGMLRDGEVRLGYGTLAGLTGTVTACTATIQPVAYLALMDEVRVPPAHQFINSTLNSADTLLPGRGLYTHIAMLNSATFDAITAGDFATISADLGFGDVIASQRTEALTALFAQSFPSVPVGGVQGEPAAASDDNTKRINGASPTAIAAQVADLQPVLFNGFGAKLSKTYRAETGIRLRWTGTQSTGVALLGRILEQPPAVVQRMATLACDALKREPKSIGIKTLSKKEYTGPQKPFMPWVVKV